MKRRKRQGFSLIEILLVVIIISVLTGASLPNLKKSFSGLQLKSFSQEFLAFINYLRERSIVEGEVIFLNIDSEKKECRAKIKDGGLRLKTCPIPAQIKLQTDKKEIIFYPDGIIDKVTISLTDGYNESITLTTKGVWGGAKIIQD